MGNSFPLLPLCGWIHPGLWTWSGFPVLLSSAALLGQVEDVPHGEHVPGAKGYHGLPTADVQAGF